jgi:ribosomal protein S18 acetylase RimI-like enzyme
LLVRRINEADLPAVQKLRREALAADPLAFTASADSPIVLSEDAAVFAAFDSDAPVGMVGVYLQKSAKLRHRAEIWGFFVQPSARGRGLGRKLMEAAIAHARTWNGVVQVQLGVSHTAVAAKQLYESLGFKEWGLEPRALLWQGTAVDEYHLTLRFDE